MMEINIRRAAIKDAVILPKIENSAGQAFRQVPDLAWFADGADLPTEWHRRVIAQGTCWVTVDALDCPIGFLSAEVFSNPIRKMLRHVQFFAGAIRSSIFELDKSSSLTGSTSTRIRSNMTTSYSPSVA